MSEGPTLPSENPELVLQRGDAGGAFRAEMAVQNFFLGYWRHMLAIVAVGLIGVLLYGTWQNNVERNQRFATERVAAVEKELPAPIPQLPMMKEAGGPGLDNAVLVSSAKTLDTIGDEEGGVASVEAWLKAAELYRLAGVPADQRRVLDKAAAGSRGALHFAAVSALGNLDLAEGQNDIAVERFKGLATNFDGFLGQQAQLDLGSVYEYLGKKDEAQKVYEEFVVRWPDSPRKEEVESRRERLAGSEG